MPGKHEGWLQLFNGTLSLGGSPSGLAVKNPPANARDAGLIPESGRSPGEGNGNPLQYSCLGNSMDRRVWRAIVHGVAKSRTQLSDWLYYNSNKFPHHLSIPFSQATPQIHSTNWKRRSQWTGFWLTRHRGRCVRSPLSEFWAKGWHLCQETGGSPGGKLTVLWEETNRVLRVRFWFCLVIPLQSSPGHIQELPVSTTMLCLCMNRPARITRHFIKPLSC